MYKYIKNREDLDIKEFQGNLGRTMVISVDTEATDKDPIVAEWILFQIKLADQIYLFDSRTVDLNFLIYIIELINSSGKRVISHNSKYDLKMIFLGTGIFLKNNHDTMLVESFIYKGVGKVFYSLAELVEKYCNEILEKEVRSSFIAFKGELSTEQLTYSALDVEYLETIYDAQMELIFQRGLERIYTLEMNLVPVVARMELNGVFVDSDEWLALEAKAIEDRKKSFELILNTIVDNINFSKYDNGFVLAKAFYIPVRTKRERLTLESIVDASFLKDWLKENININSPKQLLNILNCIFHLKVKSTNEKILKDVNDKIIVPHILTYREHNKNITTYGSAWLNNISFATGRVHSEFLQNGTESGRFSSINPNLQQIPKDPEYRKPFKAPPGKLILGMDYSQQEYRLAGAISREPVIIDAYMHGKDMHTATASIIFGKKLEEVTKEERNVGKTINFAVLYGSTEFGLAYNLKIDTDTATSFLKAFYEGYPVLTAFKEAMEDAIIEKGYSSTILGRKRYWERPLMYIDFREMERLDKQIRREGFNHLIQGTGADVTKLAMIKMTEENPFGDSFKLVMQIHDEIVVEIDETIKDEAVKFGVKCMVDVFQPFLGNIPALVDPHVGDCWSK
jgi:DNA polymerase I